MRRVFIGLVVLLCILTVGCGIAGQKAQESPVVAQDILLGADSVSEAFEMTVPADAMDAAEQGKDALEAEKTDIQTQLDSINDQIKNLQWLRDSYVLENPADLDDKLAQCDELITKAKASLQRLQQRMTQNSQNLGALSDEEGISEETLIEPFEETAVETPAT